MSIHAHRVSGLADELKLASLHAGPHAIHLALSDDERRLVHWMENEESILAADAITELELGEDEAHALLAKLHAKGIVYKETADGKVSYRVSKYHRDIHRSVHEKSPEREELRQGLISGMSKYVILQVLSLGLTYLTQVMLARWFGSAIYGSYSLAATFATVLAYVGALGFPTGGLQRFLPQYAKDEKWGLFKGLLMQSTQLSLLAGGVLALIAAPAVWAAPDLPTVMKAAFVIAALLIPIEAFSQVLASVFQSLKQWIASYFSDQIFIPAVFLLAVFGVWTLRGELNAFHLVMIALAVHALAMLVQVVWMRGTLPAPVKSAARETQTHQWLQTSLPLLMATLLGVIVYRADLLVVGWMRDTAEAGIYSAVLTTAEIFGVFLTAANNVATPSIGPLFAKKEMATLQYLLSKATTFAFFPALLGSALCAVFATQILGLFGSGFEAGRSALLVLLAAQVFKAGLGAPTMLVVMSGQQKRVAQIYLASAAIDVVLLMVLVPRFGLLGASLASFAAIVTTQVVLCVLAARHAGVNTSILGALRSGASEAAS